VSDLFWPGDERADGLLDDAALLGALVAVEQAWLDALLEAGLAPASPTLTAVVEPADLAREAEAGGNPVIPLVRRLREQSSWVHRGLTSQDVVDTALMLCLGDVLERVEDELERQVSALAALADEHRGTVMAGRTLTQHAVPVTFGLKAAGWLTGVLDALEALAGVRLPAQLGGAAGTLSAVVEIAGSPEAALRLTAAAAERLGLEPDAPWHTSRRPVTAVGDALVACTDAWGRIATDVATLSRPEIGEVTEGAGGGSSTMPHKANPVLSVLLRRTALTTPPLAATLHTAAALAGDERPDGAWHAEWATLRDLGRRTAAAAGQATDLVTGLRVHADRMAATVAGADGDLTAERASIAAFLGRPAEDTPYLGAADLVVDRVLDRARSLEREIP
jgi:3-carboxy-cis,cis-muconate cycloisomerase